MPSHLTECPQVAKWESWMVGLIVCGADDQYHLPLSQSREDIEVWEPDPAPSAKLVPITLPGHGSQLCL